MGKNTADGGLRHRCAKNRRAVVGDHGAPGAGRIDLGQRGKYLDLRHDGKSEAAEFAAQTHPPKAIGSKCCDRLVDESSAAIGFGCARL